MCTVSYKVKMISSLSLMAVWKATFSFSLAVSSGSLSCCKRHILYISHWHIISIVTVYSLTWPLITLRTTSSLPTSSSTPLIRSGFFAMPLIRLGSFEYVSHACDSLVSSSEAGIGTGFDRCGGYADTIELRGSRRGWWIAISSHTRRKNDVAKIYALSRNASRNKCVAFFLSRSDGSKMFVVKDRIGYRRLAKQ